METTNKVSQNRATRRHQPALRRACSFSLDLRVIKAIDQRAEGENRSRVVEHLLVKALGIPHPEAMGPSLASELA